jgi:hypothetical protein
MPPSTTRETDRQATAEATLRVVTAGIEYTGSDLNPACKRHASPHKSQFSCQVEPGAPMKFTFAESGRSHKSLALQSDR